MKFAAAALIGAIEATKIRDDAFPPLVNPTPWDKDSLAPCPEDETRNILDDGYTQKVKWPYVGSTCALQISEDVTLVMLGGPEAELGGKAPAAKKPAAAAKKPEVPIGAPNLDNLEHCPDFNERYTLRNGTTMAVAYPKAGFNCNPAWSLVQTPWPANVVPANVAAGATYPAGLEHCPDRPERQTLRDGVTKPVAGVNCNADAYPAVAGTPWPYALAQGPWPANVVPANVPAGATYPAGLEHCPDRPERQTLRDGVTKPVAGVNCNADAYPAVAGTPWPYALAQAPWSANVVPANVPAGATYPAGLEHCPDLPERQTLRDGVTKPVPGVNCNGDIHNGTEGAPAPYH
jgi:hypothetical protein